MVKNLNRKFLLGGVLACGLWMGEAYSEVFVQEDALKVPYVVLYEGTTQSTNALSFLLAASACPNRDVYKLTKSQDEKPFISLLRVQKDCHEGRVELDESVEDITGISDGIIG